MGIYIDILSVCDHFFSHHQAEMLLLSLQPLCTVVVLVYTYVVHNAHMYAAAPAHHA